MIITTHKKYLLERCYERGYNIDDVMDCVIDMKKDIWTIDTDHKSYPRVRQSLKVGTELKKLLSKMGIESTSGCKCSDRAKHMDYMEQIDPGWTERNIEEVVDWMEQEARNRNLPFLRTPAKMLVKLAIRRAKKE